MSPQRMIHIDTKWVVAKTENEADIFPDMAIPNIGDHTK